MYEPSYDDSGARSDARVGDGERDRRADAATPGMVRSLFSRSATVQPTAYTLAQRRGSVTLSRTQQITIKYMK